MKVNNPKLSFKNKINSSFNNDNKRGNEAVLAVISRPGAPVLRPCIRGFHFRTEERGADDVQVTRPAGQGLNCLTVLTIRAQRLKGIMARK